MVEHGLTGGIRVSSFHRRQHCAVPRRRECGTAAGQRLLPRATHQSGQGPQQQRKDGIARGLGQQVVEAQIGVDLLVGSVGPRTTGGRTLPTAQCGPAWPARRPARQWPLPADGEPRSSPRASDPRAAKRCETCPRRPANRPAAPAADGLARPRPALGPPKSALPRGPPSARRPGFRPAGPRGAALGSASKTPAMICARNRSATS